MPKPILFRWTQWVWPLLIGVGSAAGVLWLGATYEVIDPITKQTTTSLELLRGFTWTSRSTWAVLAAIVCVLIRDFGYIVRLRILSFQSFSWRQSTENILLWELSSASHRVSLVVLRQPWSFCTGMASNGARVWPLYSQPPCSMKPFICSPFHWFLGFQSGAGHPIFPAINEDLSLLDWGLSSLFGVAYAFIASLTALMWFGLVLRPEKTHRFIQRLGASRPLERWGGRIKQWSTDLLEASQDIRHAPRSFWIQGFAATCASWTARFLTLNAVLLIFYPHIAHGAVLARQLVLWIVLSISPTPGSSGVAELGLPSFLGDLTGGWIHGRGSAHLAHHDVLHLPSWLGCLYSPNGGFEPRKGN